ncbi:protease S8 tripeptidyl peptidase I [Talaromyces proteolyticus]|uniref:tripeptidyl-peptidase II n=1 Tax=Talaromyces proteolyticus TaxID=1131652 RepID=A0AAD4KW50_9EURO|nr:protease S8 tripeptidyl peptidase I [Talaromyces proteolyticus]KAH8702313.1 protease S8 tripeptidyl peptidase I [Talaromyces proteolyticus]
MRLFKALNTALLVSVVTAATILNNSPSLKSRVLHERRSSAPASSWVKRSQAPRDFVLPIHIGISSQNIEEGHYHLMDISDPRSENFGKHWTPKQVYDFFSPSKKSVENVRGWLASNGIDKHRHKVASSRGYIQFHATVDEAESLLGTQYNIWEHTNTGEISISCDEYHVSRDIQHHIDFITPTIGLDAASGSHLTIRNKKRASIQRARLAHSSEKSMKKTVFQNQTSCSDNVTPECIKALYHISPSSSTTNQPGNDLGLYETALSYDQMNLDWFFSLYAPGIPNGTHPISNNIDGGVGAVPAGMGGGETMLDIEMVYPIIYPQSVKIFQVYGLMDTLFGRNETGLFNQFLDALDASYCTYDGGDDPDIDPRFPDGHTWNGTRQCGIYKPTNIISISYAVAEDAYTPAYATRQCYEYMKLGLMGTSIIVASGDNGTLARFPNEGCQANGAQRPSFPASCPYVTSVGATQIPPNGTIHDPEIAVIPDEGGFTSGGGFSNIFPRPSYQDDAVSSFLNDNTHLPKSSTYNASSRGFPDISAIGWNIPSVSQNSSSLGFGTSASAPIFAAMINLINGERIAARKSPLGFLNPALYNNINVFNDVVSGYNWGCNAEKAFYASKGWDPVTGLGTPNYLKLRDALLNLP